ncbi:MAG: N-acetylmuramidase domain-containing protein [Acidobacteriota bacterium]|nr:N-acetylmuramidase domain-containing protein [Acidobacteriota bacterium]
MAKDFVGRSRALSTDGFATTAQSLAVKAQEIWAVLAVETSGCGFLADRRPQILFERHIFHRLTGGRFDDGDISDPKPGGYGPGGAAQYERLARAVDKDRGAALESTSWGLGQIMGENFAAAGFADVETMVAAMIDSEDSQLEAVASFLKASHLDLPLHAHDWASFAAGYNGPSYAKNRYDTQLQGEFQKYSFGVMPDLDLRAAQLYLTFLGFHPGPVDGILGKLTSAALVDFQTQHGLDATGEVDAAVLEALAGAALPA